MGVPWFAAWDLAFHCAPLSLVDVDFAKEQVELLLLTRYQHPNGQIPAYEWNFSDVNPPVTAWAALWVYEREAEIRGEGDHEFLARVFERLLTNFTWWVNRKDPDDRNLFQGGFLGLDNIGIFDRSAPLPGGGTLEQADGTAWMALYCQWMLQIAVELARSDPFFSDIALKFISHFGWISIALDPPGDNPGLWDEEDGFFYDVMRMPDGTRIPLKVRSLVGLLPLCAATVFDAEVLDGNPRFMERVDAFATHFSDMVPALANRPGPSPEGRAMLSLVDEGRLRRILRRCSTRTSSSARTGSGRSRGATSTSPASSTGAGRSTIVRYLPAESDTGMFGGNSNWRGPVWFPMNLVILRGLLQAHRYYGDRFKIECPTGSGNEMTLLEVCAEISGRLTATFTRDEHGRRPVYGGTRDVPGEPALVRPDPVPRVLPRRQRRRDRREPPDGVDGNRRAAVPDDRGVPRAGRRGAGARPSSGRCACRPGRRSTRSTPPSGSSASGATADARSRSPRSPGRRGTRSPRCPSTPSG